MVLFLFTLGISSAEAMYQTGAETVKPGKKINFQGNLYENGEPATGDRQFIFTIALDNGESWTETQTVSVLNGLYAVVLGSVSPLPYDLFFEAEERTLQVSIGNTVLGSSVLYAPFALGEEEVEIEIEEEGTEFVELESLTEPDSIALDVRLFGKGQGPISMAIKAVAETDTTNTGVAGVAAGSDVNRSFQTGVRGNAFSNNSSAWATGVWGVGYGDAGGTTYGLRGEVLGTGANFSAAARGLNFIEPSETGIRYGGFFDTRQGAGSPYLGNSVGVMARAVGSVNNIGLVGEGFGSGESNIGVQGRAARGTIKNIGVEGFAFSGAEENIGVFGTTSDSGEFDFAGVFEKTPLNLRKGSSLLIRDQDNAIKAIMNVNFQKTGEIFLMGENGDRNFDITSSSFNRNWGLFNLYGSSRASRLINMTVEEDGSGGEIGVINVNATDGRSFKITPDGVIAPSMSENFTVKNTLNINNDSNPNSLGVTISEIGQIKSLGVNGKSNIEIGASLANTNWGDFRLYGSSLSQSLVNMGVSDNGNGEEVGQVSIRSSTDEASQLFMSPEIVQVLSNTGGFTLQKNALSFANTSGFSLVDLGAATNNSGYTRLYGSNGNLNIEMGSGVSEDAGALTLYGSQGRSGREPISLRVADNGSGEETGVITISSGNSNGVTLQDNNMSFSTSTGNPIELGSTSDNTGFATIRGANNQALINMGKSSANPNWADLTLNGSVQATPLINMTVVDNNNGFGETGEISLMSAAMTGSRVNLNSQRVSFISNTGNNGTLQDSGLILNAANGSTVINVGRASNNSGFAKFYGANGSNLLDIDIADINGSEERATISLRSSVGASTTIEAGAIRIPDQNVGAINSIFSGNAVLFNGQNNRQSQFSADLFFMNNGNGLFTSHTEQSLQFLNAGTSTFDFSNNTGDLSISGALESKNVLIKAANGVFETELNEGGVKVTVNDGSSSQFTNSNASFTSNTGASGTIQSNAVVFTAPGGATRLSFFQESADLFIAGSLTQSSDVRLKKNISTLDSGLALVNQLRGVSYNWKEKGRPENKIGFIAQEVEAILPELVSTNKDGFKSVSYAEMTAVLVEAVKELNAKVEKLATENADLKAERSQLKAEVEKVEALAERLAQIEALLSSANPNKANK